MRTARPPDCCFSYEAEGALGRDELENDAEEDGVGRDARGQPAIRGEKERGGGLVGANGNSAGENAGRRPHRRCSRGPTPRTKGTYIYTYTSLSLSHFSSSFLQKPGLFSILTRRIAGNRPLPSGIALFVSSSSLDGSRNEQNRKRPPFDRANSR